MGQLVLILVLLTNIQMEQRVKLAMVLAQRVLEDNQLNVLPAHQDSH